MSWRNGEMANLRNYENAVVIKCCCGFAKLPRCPLISRQSCEDPTSYAGVLRSIYYGLVDGSWFHQSSIRTFSTDQQPLLRPLALVIGWATTKPFMIWLILSMLDLSRSRSCCGQVLSERWVGLGSDQWRCSNTISCGDGYVTAA
jgi:hypothetical protein